jgi:hypothetical protein
MFMCIYIDIFLATGDAKYTDAPASQPTANLTLRREHIVYEYIDMCMWVFVVTYMYIYICVCIYAYI